MAKKPPVQVHVQSSDFKSLLTLQQQSLQTLQSIEDLTKTLRVTEIASLVETKKIDDENQEEIKLGKDSIKLQQEQIKTLKQIEKHNKEFKEALKTRDEEANAIANIAKSVKTFKTLGEKFGEFTKKFKDLGSPGGLKLASMKAFNVGGIFKNKIADEEFVQTQMKLGTEKTREQLLEEAPVARQKAKDIQNNETKIKEFQKLTGVSESDMSKYKGGRELLDRRQKLTEDYKQYDVRAKMVERTDDGYTKPTQKEISQPSAENKSNALNPASGITPSSENSSTMKIVPDNSTSIKETPTQQFADNAQTEEQNIENARLIGQQTSLLEKIEQNTRGDSPEQKAKPEENKSSGGLLGGLLGGGGGKALSALKDFGMGLVLVAGSLYIAAKAFQNFAEVAWEDVGKGLVVLGGMVVAALALDKAKGQIIAGAASLGVLGLSLWGISEAFKTFAELDWETIGKGMAAVAGIGVIGAIAGSAAPLLLAGGAALGVLGAGLWVIGEAMQSVGEGFEKLTVGMQELGKLDGSNLLKVAAGLAALGPAMALFAVGNVAAGISNLVTGFLSAVTGQKSPVDQLVEIGKSGEGVQKAGIGMEKLANGMKAFSEIKSGTLKQLNDFPWDKATKFVAAGGTMQADSSKVYNASKQNADEQAKVDTKPSAGNTTVVNAPVTNSSTTNQMIKSPIRNQESSQQRYINRRLGMS